MLRESLLSPVTHVSRACTGGSCKRVAVAAMVLRAAKNRRFLVHRDWMIRSYVLTRTFVGCRIATNYDFFPALGAESVTASTWVNSIVPFVIFEIALQWKAGSKPNPQRP